MRIGIDCDEVLFPLVENLCPFLNKKYQLNLNQSSFTTYQFWEHYNSTRDKAIDDFLEFTDSSEFSEIAPIRGAVKSIDELKKFGELYLVTSRQHSLRDKTESWIHRYFSGKFSKIIFGNSFSKTGAKISKRDICHENSINTLLEDLPDYAKEVSLEIPVILFDKPWNQSAECLPNILRVGNWRKPGEDWKQAVEATRNMARARMLNLDYHD